jgi:hypothetical protein
MKNKDLLVKELKLAQGATAREKGAGWQTSMLF